MFFVSNRFKGTNVTSLLHSVLWPTGCHLSLSPTLSNLALPACLPASFQWAGSRAFLSSLLV